MTSEDALLVIRVALADIPPAEQAHVIAAALGLGFGHIEDNWQPDDAAETLSRLLALAATQIADGPPSYSGVVDAQSWAKELIARAREVA